MTEKEIFEHLFETALRSNDTDGVVACCLVRSGEVIADAVSAGVEHAEYELIKKLSAERTEILPDDILYVTVQPCDRRSSPEGEALGDCTTNAIRAGIKNVVYAATYPKSLQSLKQFYEAGVSARQVGDIAIIKQAVELFNSTNKNIEKHIPLPGCTVDIHQRLHEARAKTGKTVFVAVDGRGGSGKSTLARLLSEELRAGIIHTDDFASWNNPFNWDTDIIKNVFMPVMKGVSMLSYQPSSWWEGQRPALVENQPVTPVMIIEGVGAARKEFDDYISVRIFVDTPRETCLQRGVARDRDTGKSEDTLIRVWEGWFEAEDEYFKNDNPRDKADIVVDGTQPFEMQINFKGV